MGEPPKYVVRLATDEDRSDVIRLVSEWYEHDVTERYEWFYQRNPHGRALSWIAVDESTGSVDAVTSVFPRLVFVDGQKRLGSIGGDAYVAPRARRQGLATRMHAACRADMGPGTVEFMYGVPLVHNLKALLRAGTTEVCTFKRYVRPLTPDFMTPKIRARAPEWLNRTLPGAALDLVGEGALAMLARKDRRIAGAWSVEEATTFGAEWDEWMDAHIPQEGLCCVRDAAYLNFSYTPEKRKSQTPFFVRRDGELFGLFTLQGDPSRKTALLADAITSNDPEHFRTLLSLMIGKATGDGFSSLELSMTPFQELPDVLKDAGFIERPDNESSVFQVLSADVGLPASALERPDGWYFQHGDQDL